MIRWLAGLRRAQASPLTGAPQHRRRKTYSADSGYVYQYYFLGYRVTRIAGTSATEYVFDVSADRKTSSSVSVFVGDDATGAWERSQNRDLNAIERYAIAKIALFKAFDEREGARQMREAVWVRAAAVKEILQTLGID